MTDYTVCKPPTNTYKSRVTVLSCDDKDTPSLPSVLTLMESKPQKAGKHYTLDNMQLDTDNPFNQLPKVNGYESVADVSGDKPAKLSPITHIDKRERVECPVIYTAKKPAKKRLQASTGHKAYYQSECNNSGDYEKTTSNKPAILAGNERGQTSPTLGHKVKIRGSNESIPYK